MKEMKENFSKMPRTVWALGLVSLLMDTSSEIVHGLLPVFLISVLGTNYSVVGFIEGIGEACAMILKVFSGSFSDRWGKRKPLILLGYSMGALSKPLFAMASTPTLILGARLFDRTGKGIRGAPRDALLADSAPPELRGEAFGLRQSLDTVGAFLGPILAILLMSVTHGNYRLIFWIALIPGILSVAVLHFGVQERDVKQPDVKQPIELKRLSWNVFREFPSLFWLVAFVGAIFQLARFSEAFLILRAKDLGLSLAMAPAVLVAMNIIYSLSAYPMGWISDRIPRERLVLVGFIVLIFADFVLGFSTHLSFVFAGVLLWGLHLGLTQGVLAALVADTSPTHLRGTAYGLFNLVSAVALLLASGIAGILWDQFGAKITFLTSALFSCTGIFVLNILYRIKPQLFARSK